jgi:hypothetical protein
MYLNEVLLALDGQSKIEFQLPNGELVPAHFHVTEVGLNTKSFIDCGGTVRNEQRIVFQLWEENDYDHRLHPDKLVKIIELSQNTLNLPNEIVEVEYQGPTIGKYGLSFSKGTFYLEPLQTNCLAKDACGIESAPKEKVSISSLNNANTCTPGSGCC